TTEDLTEDPDDQAPAVRGQAAQAGPRAPGPGEQPDANPDLAPDGRRRGVDRMIGPSPHAPVRYLLHPSRRPRRSGLDHLRREAERHRLLGLQDAVEDPQDADADAQHAARWRLGERGRRRGPGAPRAGSRNPFPGTDPHQGEQEENQQDNDPLMDESRAERGYHRRVHEL